MAVLRHTGIAAAAAAAVALLAPALPASVHDRNDQERPTQAGSHPLTCDFHAQMHGTLTVAG